MKIPIQDKATNVANNHMKSESIPGFVSRQKG